MSWPENLSSVDCIGFPNTILPAIKGAIEKHLVSWDTTKTKIFIDFASGQFEFADCIWELEGRNELAISVKLINGDPTAESLTYAVLKG